MEHECGVKEHAGLERLIQNVCMGRKALPDPTLGKDVAFLGHLIDELTEKLARYQEAHRNAEES